MMMWDGQPGNYTFHPQAQNFHLFGHIAGMPDETDATKILTVSSRRTGGDHQDALYYVDEYYPARPEIQQPLPEWRN